MAGADPRLRDLRGRQLPAHHDWRSKIPTWDASKCKQCLLCTPFCPDSSIPVSGGKRSDFDYDHCKGCGICYKVCPFGAIDWKEVH